MLFNSVHFLLFFPIVTLVYFVIPHKARWIWLLLTSYYFYMSWNPKYAILIGLSTIITYLSGLLIQHSERHHNEVLRTRQKKLWVALSFISNLLILFFFKYFDFALNTVATVLSIFGIQFAQPAFDVILPVGISFYTFQALSYTMDVYRGDIYAERNLAKYALFVSFFPQLVAGPIERSKNLLVQINVVPTFNYDRVKRGLMLMLWGFFQKLVIADRVASLVNQVFDHYTQYSGFQIVVAAIMFSFQIYCDFSGYSDIAIGAAQVLGFQLMDNFKQPYFSTSIQDFWRRWHISLSTWFRDYLYIPLGGNRCSRLRKYLNLMVTFLISGLWHGASWNYVIWGGLHGAYQIIGDILKPIKKRLWSSLRIRQEATSFMLGKALVTYVLVVFAWIFFRAPSGFDAIHIIERIFSDFNIWVFTDGSLYDLGLGQKDFLLSVISIFVLFVINYLQSKMQLRDTLLRQNLAFQWAVVYAAIATILVTGIYGPGFQDSQFLYFQF